MRSQCLTPTYQVHPQRRSTHSALTRTTRCWSSLTDTIQRDTEATYSLAEVMSCVRAYIRKFRTGTHFDQLGRAPELSEAYVHVAFRTDHKRFEQESRAPYSGVVALLYVLLGEHFCRIHQTLRVTPAMEAGITDHVWEIEEIVGLLAEKKITE